MHEYLQHNLLRSFKTCTIYIYIYIYSNQSPPCDKCELDETSVISHYTLCLDCWVLHSESLIHLCHFSLGLHMLALAHPYPWFNLPFLPFGGSYFTIYSFRMSAKRMELLSFGILYSYTWHSVQILPNLDISFKTCIIHFCVTILKQCPSLSLSLSHIWL